MKSFEICNVDTEYLRVVESMGKGLVMLKIQRLEEPIGANYHYYFNNGRKPPLDIAFSPYDNNIAYITYFIQDESVPILKNIPEINYLESNIKIKKDVFPEKCYEINLYADFCIFLNKNNLVVLRRGEVSTQTAYHIGEKIMC